MLVLCNRSKDGEATGAYIGVLDIRRAKGKLGMLSFFLNHQLLEVVLLRLKIQPKPQKSRSPLLHLPPPLPLSFNQNPLLLHNHRQV
jgi:hypothetical protein